VLRRLVDLDSGSCSADRSKHVQVLLLRHQLGVLRRQKGRPAAVPADRILLASASRVIPPGSWASCAAGPRASPLSIKRASAEPHPGPRPAEARSRTIAHAALEPERSSGAVTEATAPGHGRGAADPCSLILRPML
jgi:hypothetical protein